MKCEICGRKASWVVFHGKAEELESAGHAVCRKHALADRTLTAIEPLVSFEHSAKEKI